MEERKKEARMPEIRDELLDAVAGAPHSHTILMKAS